MTAQAGGTASLSQRKKQLRQQLRQLRAAVPRSERRRAARAAALHLARACRRWNARRVAVYLSMPEEFDTRALIRLLHSRGCALYAPRVTPARQLRFAPLSAGAPLRRNRYGIPEPIAAARGRPALIVLPLVAFDASGHRLGMGGGYYDRLLARDRPFRRPLRVGLAYARQEVKKVPVHAQDVRLDAVVTERGLRVFR